MENKLYHRISARKYKKIFTVFSLILLLMFVSLTPLLALANHAPCESIEIQNLSSYTIPVTKEKSDACGKRENRFIKTGSEIHRFKIEKGQEIKILMQGGGTFPIIKQVPGLPSPHKVEKSLFIEFRGSINLPQVSIKPITTPTIS